MQITRKAAHVFSVKVFNICTVTIDAKNREEAERRGEQIETDINAIQVDRIARIEEIGRVLIGKVKAEYCPEYLKLKTLTDTGMTMYKAFRKLYPDVPDWIARHAFAAYEQNNLTFELFKGNRLNKHTKEATKGYHILAMVSQTRKLRGIKIDFHTFDKNRYANVTGESKIAPAPKEKRGEHGKVTQPKGSNKFKGFNHAETPGVSGSGKSGTTATAKKIDNA